jgi:glyoxalase family protein
MALELTGLHHLTAVTANARENLRFYTKVLGLRLVKRTVNQDDTTAYHLFYGDGRASPGSDITFFDWPTAPEVRGTHSVVRTAFRVEGVSSLEWWKNHLEDNGVKTSDIAERAGHMSLDFEDFEGQRLRLVNDTRAGGAHPWDKSPVPPERQIKGLGPITMSVPDLARSEPVLTLVMNMRKVRTHPATADQGEIHVFAMGDGGASAELHVAVEPDLPFARPGAGGVHHIAFRTPDKDQFDKWVARATQAGLRTSGEVERYYFTSLYFREPNGILFEIATDGPGFDVDEPMETLGEHLALPPFLEPKRAQIEAGLKPID